MLLQHKAHNSIWFIILTLKNHWEQKDQREQKYWEQKDQKLTFLE